MIAAWICLHLSFKVTMPLSSILIGPSRHVFLLHESQKRWLVPRLNGLLLVVRGPLHYRRKLLCFLRYGVVAFAKGLAILECKAVLSTGDWHLRGSRAGCCGSVAKKVQCVASLEAMGLDPWIQGLESLALKFKLPGSAPYIPRWLPSHFKIGEESKSRPESYESIEAVSW